MGPRQRPTVSGRRVSRLVRGSASWAATLLSGALLGLGLHAPAAAQGRKAPPPPEPRKVIYDPDPGSCQAEQIRQAYARHLEPFADQSEAVLAHLRKVQWQMTASTLQRCVSKGLMQPEDARALQRELAPQSSGSTRP